MNSKTISTPFIIFSFLLLSSCGGDGKGDGVYNPRNPNGAGPAAVSLSKDGGEFAPGDLGSAGNYVILAKTGISDVVALGTIVTGDIGVSPVAASYITNFSLVADGSNQFSTSNKVVGNVYASDYAVPTPSNLTTAIGNMETAYTDAAGRNPPDHTELYAGNLTGQTLTPDLYKWGTDVSIDAAGTVNLNGSATDIWIFQIAGNVVLNAGATITLLGGALPENIYWQVAGQVTLHTTAQMKGIIFSKTAIVMNTGASLDGRAYAQTAVTLDDNAVTEP
jgi:hypothetical protein